MCLISSLIVGTVTAVPPKRLCGDAHQPVTQYATHVGSTKKPGMLPGLPISNVPTLSPRPTVHARRQAHRHRLLPQHHHPLKFHSQAYPIECLSIHRDPALVEGIATVPVVQKDVADVLRTTIESHGRPMFHPSSTLPPTQRVMLIVRPDRPRGQLLLPQPNKRQRVKAIHPWSLHARIAAPL